MNTAVRVVGIGGTLREHSTSLWALQHALEAARTAGAVTELIDLRRYRLPMYEPDAELDHLDESVQDFVRRIKHGDAFLISTAAYHGTLAGLTKNALDYLEYLSDAPRPYLHNKPVGLIATAGGDQAAVNSIAAMVHAVHSLRGFALPLSVPIHHAGKAFDSDGHVIDTKTANRLNQLGKMVVETALRFRSESVPSF